MFRDATHPFHLVEVSPWPLLTANALFSLLATAVISLHDIDLRGLRWLTPIVTLSGIILWFRDITIEGTYLRDHTLYVQKALSMGVVLFIVTEVFFFLSIFWAYFHSSLSPAVELRSQWPPAGITPLNPIGVPLLNTILLLTSRATLTFAHHALICNQRKRALLRTLVTISVALVFTALQGLEYQDCGFTMRDRVYRSVFYFSTGFHRAHVVIRTIFIRVILYRIMQHHTTREHHIGLERAILYWHFVDLVWLFLYISVYWWRS